MDAGVVAALIAAFASVIVAALSALFAWRGQRALQGQQEKLALLTDELERRRSRSEALTEYQFEARKRLYAQCEPLFFQLADASDHALRKCRDLAMPEVWKELESIRKNLDATKGPWMLCDSSELIAIAYALFVPLVVFCQLRERMTQFDFSLDHGVWFRYLLGRQLYETFQDDFVLAAMEPQLAYNPLARTWRQKRLKEPAIYWWQGITRGRLERALNCFIVDGSPAGTRRVANFGEFEDFYRHAFRGNDTRLQQTVGVACNPLYNFTPFTRPVFWRVIMAQVHLHNALFRPTPANIPELAKNRAKLKDFLRLENYHDFELPNGCGHRDDAIELALEYLAQRLCAHLIIGTEHQQT